MQIIENDVLKVVISEHGAELQSIYHKGKEREFLWQGDETYWSRRAPIFFPIVGKLANNTYYIKGKDYHLTRNGFTRDLDFEVVEKLPDYVKFRLDANEHTFLVYPYDFRITVSYRLIDNRIVVKYKVYNKTNELLYFSIGGSPAFNTNLTPNGYEDYYLEFGTPLTLKTKVLDSEVGLLTYEEKVIGDKIDTLPLTYELFKENDTLILENINQVSLKNRVNDDEVKLTTFSFPLLAVWSPNRMKSPFVCLEPWQGAPDYVGLPQELSDKAYIESVYPGGKFRSMFTIDII